MTETPSNPKKGFRRKWILRLLLYGTLAVFFFYAFLIERKWIKIEKIALSPAPTLRIVHFTDLHYNGDKEYLESVVRKINDLDPDIVCFTGDLVEDEIYLSDALASLSKIKKPLYGVPGNHEYWQQLNLETIAQTFRSTGGNFIAAENGGAIAAGGKKIYLVHFPDVVDDLPGKYDLILAGHSHGGQIRFPCFGALLLPYKAKHYDYGFYNTQNGPLYVNPGIGTFFIPARLFCRPEITLISL